MSKTHKIGIIKGLDVLMHRSGRANKGDLMVSRGCGVHTPVVHKEKTRQKAKNELRGFY